MKTEYLIDGSFSEVEVSTIHKKRKSIWEAETAYVFASGETEEEALRNLATELKIVANEIMNSIKKG